MKITHAIGLGIAIIVLQALVPQLWSGIMELAMQLIFVLHDVMNIATAMVGRVHLP